MRERADRLLPALLLCSIILSPGVASAAPRGDAAGEGSPDPARAEAAFRPSELIVQLHPEAVEKIRAGLAPGEELAAGLARRPGVAALHQALGVTRVSPVFKRRGNRRGPPHPRRRAGDARWRESFFLVELRGDPDILEAVRLYQAHADVVSAQVNYVYSPDLAPNDPLYPGQYSHQVTQAEAGWDIEIGSAEVTIAVIGTGVELSHPDLAANLWENSAEIEGNLVDDDQNGFVDDRRGWDFSDDDNDPSAETDPHETQVAGVIGAVPDNATGVAGVAWDCRIMALRVAYASSEVAQAIDYAAENGARVINMSFGNYDIGKYGPDTIVETAVDQAFTAGLVLVATAGNDSIDTARYPAALENVMAVAATGPTDGRTGFTNYGAWVSLAAPGANIATTTTGGGYTNANGTSFAAPYVAGLAGLLFAKQPSLTPTSVRRRIEYSVDRIDSDAPLGSGRVNVFNALDLSGDPDLFAVVKSLASGSVLLGSVNVFGTALGEGYVLEYRPAGAEDWTFVSSGGEVVDGELGVIDLTLDGPGFYELRLTASLGPESDAHQLSIVQGDTWSLYTIATPGVGQDLFRVELPKASVRPAQPLVDSGWPSLSSRPDDDSHVYAVGPFSSSDPHSIARMNVVTGEVLVFPELGDLEGLYPGVPVELWGLAIRPDAPDAAIASAFVLSLPSWVLIPLDLETGAATGPVVLTDYEPRSLVFSPDGSTLFAARGELAQIDPATGDFSIIGGDLDPVWGLAFSPDGDQLLAALGPPTSELVTLDPATGAITSVLGGFSGTGLAFLPAECGESGDLDGDGGVDQWDVDLFRGHLADPFGSALSPGARGRCNVIGVRRPCDVLDVVVLRRALAQPARPPGIAQVCAGEEP